MECKLCVMDDSDEDIIFNESGVCNYCIDSSASYKNLFNISEIEAKENLNNFFNEIRFKKKTGDYDAIIGLSGGVDSSYVALLAHKYGLNPLLIHFDNGWNTNKAVTNIQKIVDKTGFDYTCLIIDWDEFKDLQRSFLLAGVIDIEMITDNAILASMMHYRKKYNVKYIISGNNFSTEYTVPRSWLWNKVDTPNIKFIHSRFGSEKLSSFKFVNPYIWYFKKIISDKYILEPLNLFHFKKMDAIAELKEYFGWEYYGGKHYESIFTKFYQSYVLPEKFGIDKRRPHLSALIRNGEITRYEAIDELKKPLYDFKQINNEIDYVLKKLSLSHAQFEKIMKSDPIRHDHYRSIKRPLSLLKLK